MLETFCWSHHGNPSNLRLRLGAIVLRAHSTESLCPWWVKAWKCFLFTLMKLDNQAGHQKKCVHLSIISPIHAFTEHTNLAIFEFGSSEGHLCYLSFSISSYLMSNKVTSDSLKMLFSVSFTENNENFEVFFVG